MPHRTINSFSAEAFHAILFLMSKETFVFALGALIFFSSFLGLPREYKEWLLIGCGVFLMGIGYSLRRNAFLKSLEHESGERRGDAFVESVATPPEKTPTHKDSVDMI